MNPVQDEPDPDAIAAAVSTCPSVLGLVSGPSAQVATYLPGRRISGVRVRPGHVDVHVVSRYGSSLSSIDNEVRKAVGRVIPVGVSVDVVVADIEDPWAPEEPEPEPEPKHQREELPAAPPLTPEPAAPAAPPAAPVSTQPGSATQPATPLPPTPPIPPVGGPA